MTEPKPRPEPWERQEGESEEAYQAFRGYIGQPPRGRRLHHALAKDKNVLSGWFRDHNWYDRAAAYDAKYEQIADEEREKIYRRRAEEIAFEHFEILQDAKTLVAREIAKLLDASRATDMPGLLKPGEITKLLETAVKLDRLVRGETTENVGSTDLDTSKLSLDELDTLNALLSKAGMKV